MKIDPARLTSFADCGGFTPVWVAQKSRTRGFLIPAVGDEQKLWVEIEGYED